MSLLPTIFRNGLLRPWATALIDDRGPLSYAKLLGGALHTAALIERATTRSHVGLMLPTSGAFPVALLGTWLAGRTAVSFNYLLGADDLAYTIRDSGVDCLITVGKLLEIVPEGAIPEGVRVIRLEEEAANFGKVPPLRWPRKAPADEVALLLYTSGTSGRPKGVMLTHGNLTFDALASIEHAGMTRASSFLGVLPQFHSFGVTALTLIPLVLGARVIYTARFNPKKIVELIREHRPTVFFGVPTMFGALLSVKNNRPEDFASLSFCVCGGEPLPDAIYNRCRDELGVQLLEGYGLTETSPVSNWSTPQHHRRYSVGRPLPGVQNLIVDDAGNLLPTGEEGEILIAGANLMKGYHNLPEQTSEVFVEITPPGAEKPVRAFRSGDIGKLDSEGFLYITGRKKEMLIIAGENVFPREIEEVLNDHPSVLASAVIGKQDEVRGEVPVAFVEPIEGQAPDEAALRAFCREKLPQYKVPREVRVVQALPRSGTGKILRRELKA